MRLKQLESMLQDVKQFDKPVAVWEQYPTSPHIAAHMLYTIDSVYDDVDGKIVGDLGCGCAMLGIAAAVMGCSQVIGIDIDPNALSIAQENCEEFEVENIDFIMADIEKLRLNGSDFHSQNKNKNKKKPFDVVVMNPPFGTKNKGADMIFLQKAIELSTTTVYSLHKSSTREHILKKAKEWNVGAEVVAKLRWDIPKMYNFHKKQSVDVDVDFIRFDVSSL